MKAVLEIFVDDPGLLDEKTDDELVALIVKRVGISEGWAEQALARLRKAGLTGLKGRPTGPVTVVLDLNAPGALRGRDGHDRAEPEPTDQHRTRRERRSKGGARGAATRNRNTHRRR